MSPATLTGERTGDPVHGLRVRPLGDRTVIAEIGLTGPGGTFEPAPVDLATSHLTVGLAGAVAGSLGDRAVDIVPSYRSVLIEYDPDRISHKRVVGQVRRDFETLNATGEVAPRTVTVPVAYGGTFGPDLDDVAAHTGLAPAQVIAAHSSGGDYRVAFLGFSPGYAYLLGLPDALATPRLATPRPRVPAGSVAIGGRQTGIYPQATPGGWRLIGRTAVPLFDATRSPAALLRPGDRIVFRPIERQEHEEIARQVRLGTYQPEIGWLSAEGERDARDGATRSAPMPVARVALDVISPGLLTTVQDAGRPGLGAQGISPGGALDRAAFMAANRLVDNPAGAAALEMSVTGPSLRPSDRVKVALTGADLGAELDDVPAPFWEPFTIPAGGTLSFSSARAAGTGVRGYLAVAGGIDVPLVIGSRSTDLTAGFGGLAGRVLIAGDRLPVGPDTSRPPNPSHLVGPRPRSIGRTVTLRVVVGPHDDLLAAGDLDRLLTEPYAVTSQSSHMGIRLSGPALQVGDAGNLVSEGIATGTVQVPADGQPIILLSGRGTVGGYAKVACVIDADLDLAAQLRPGTMVAFRAVTLEEAISAGRRYRELLGLLAVDDIRPAEADSPYARMIEARVGLLALAELAVQRATGRLTSDSRDGQNAGRLGEADGERTSQTGPGSTVLKYPSDREHVIRAPLLGTFHRAARSGGAPLVAVGDHMAAGVTVGSIVVLGVSNDVETESPVEIAAFLVEDGAPVEYGQPLVRVRPLSPADPGGGG